MVRRLFIALLVVGLVAGGVAGWLLFTGAAPEDLQADQARISGTTDDGWQQLAYRGMELEVPAAWVRLGTAGCDSPAEHWAPAEAEPCASGPGLWFYESATYDSDAASGVRRLPDSGSFPDGAWGGHVFRDQDVVYAQDLDPEVVRRLLRSVAGSVGT